MTRPKRILLGVTGGIAAYKTLDLVRLLRKAGYEVQVVMTRHARKLVGPDSFTALTGRQAATELFPKKRPDKSERSDAAATIRHVDLASWADLVLVAPATANILGKLASGIADDLLSTLLLAVPASTLASGRVILAPAMNVNMWFHPSVQHNISLLSGRGYVIASPAKGELACGTTGPGRLPEPQVLFDLCRTALAGRIPDLSGIRVTITAGRTEEPLDPVRIITNRSSGRMGIALCRQFSLAQARVFLICGSVSVPLPPDIQARRVRTTEEMLAAVLAHLPETDVLVMSAAPADYRPPRVGRNKTHSARFRLELVRTPDILKAVSREQHQALVVGFSLDPAQSRARRKMEKKGLDLIVANDYSTPDSDTIRPVLIRSKGHSTRLPLMKKDEFAARLVKEVAALLKGRRR